MTCGFVLAPRMCHSLCKIAGFVCLSTATAQNDHWGRFIASGHTLRCHREYSVKRVESRYSRVVSVCGSVSVCMHILYLRINKTKNEGLASPGPKLLC